MLKRLASGLAVLAATTAAAMAEVPRYDIPAHCRGAATSEGRFSRDQYDYCVGTEEAARTELRSPWARTLRWEGIRCDAPALVTGRGAGGRDSYDAYVACLESETDPWYKVPPP